ncbi:hypothetical protein FB565_004264 [Actinoplanes lutulentus]|uniref:Uncharacterized protein n=1 Tax=Actinoplanes lutulentus TaxID=1287878 RepID=A0A327ZHR3_9ACTN|nr:hypothetical protein [Actinoplanes lutulentus]MBB2944535.1 hypothetical protein [Actinoplanes lutulentus]RAK42233.1 hypothetical protein B0I29_10258 [Actinoplanes lutulentus]
MRSRSAIENRLQSWRRVREFAVPPSMIESATARRLAGDWAGACVAARFDVDFSVQAVAGSHGCEVAGLLREDLRVLAPDLLRWHLPRVGPEGLLRPGLTLSLARYGGLHLVARTDPAWADAGQRVSLALWERGGPGVTGHPHSRPDRRFRLDLHRCLWDAEQAGSLRERAGPSPAGPSPAGSSLAGPDVAGLDVAGVDLAAMGFAVHRWGDEAAILLAADGLPEGPVAVRLGAGRWLHLGPGGAVTCTGDGGRLPVLPDASTWVPPDLLLLRAGLIEPSRLHPLVAAALAPPELPASAELAVDSGPPVSMGSAGFVESPEGWPGLAGSAGPAGPAGVTGSAGLVGERFVDCGGVRHRIGLVDGVLAPLDHDPAELRREQLLIALGGTPMPCLRAVDATIRHPEDLVDVRARLDHGDYAGALDTLEALLGPGALLREGALRDELEAAADQRVIHGLFRAGMAGHCPPRSPEETERRRKVRTRPRLSRSR